MLLEISQNSVENTCTRVFFNNGVGLMPATLLKKDSDTGAFLQILQNFFQLIFLHLLATASVVSVTTIAYYLVYTI